VTFSTILALADAAYANQSIILPLLPRGHHLVSRVRNNSVACFSPEQPSQRGKGRPRIYGDKAHGDLLGMTGNLSSQKATR